jgi:Family of unknown function (DUF5906)
MTDEVHLQDFIAYLPDHTYVFKETREVWLAASVNGRIPPVPLYGAHGEPLLDAKGNPRTINASRWLDQNRSAEQATWCPGEPMLIRDRLIIDGGWIDRKGVTCFNFYRPPTIKLGDPAKVTPWLELVHKVFPDDADHIISWAAHRVQRPAEKINHALVLGGPPGIGKDTIFEPIKRAIGPWNFEEVTPSQTFGRFNGFVKSVILRISEARDQGDVNRIQFYDHLKIYTASPPDVIRVDEKHIREHRALNCTGVIITTNYKDALFLPPEDRRYYVAWSDLSKDHFGNDEHERAAYWTKVYQWFDNDGDRHVTAFLAQYDLSHFNPKAPPPKTTAFWDIVERSRATEDTEVADALDRTTEIPKDREHINRSDWPDAITVKSLANATDDPGFRDWLLNRNNRRIIPHRLEANGYVCVRNDAAKDGCWVINKRRERVYAKSELSIRDQMKAAQTLSDETKTAAERTETTTKRPCWQYNGEEEF